MATISTGEKLRSLREKRSLVEVSAELNISVSALAMYERDERMPRDEVKVKIAKYYGKGVEELFFANYLH